MSKIEPDGCPHCGEKPWISGQRKVTPRKAFCINPQCPMRRSYHRREDAVKAWNTRVKEPQ